jgi:hypothetical protein
LAAHDGDVVKFEEVARVGAAHAVRGEIVGHVTTSSPRESATE